MSSKLRKNLKLKSVSANLYDANYIASFFGITLNALYLRMHFDNFPKATKINGKLYFDFNEILAHFKKNDENEAFCFLVRDEIRTLVDTSKLTRIKLGQLLGAKNPSVAGGAVYLRNISIERAMFLKIELQKIGLRLDIDEQRSFSEQKKERLDYIYTLWDALLGLYEAEKLTKRQIGSFVVTTKCGFIGKSILEYAPSYKVAKIIKLKLIQNNLLLS
jgi:hypothetical protein